MPDGSLPSITAKLSIVRHWELVVLRPTSPLNRRSPTKADFLKAEYFGLGSSVPGLYGYRPILSRTRRWSQEMVGKIDAIQEIGQTVVMTEQIEKLVTDIHDTFIVYYHILWNCQHFSILLARLLVDSDRSINVLNQLISQRREEVEDFVYRRHLITMGGALLQNLHPLLCSFVIGYGCFSYILDIYKLARVKGILNDLRNIYPTLAQLDFDNTRE